MHSQKIENVRIKLLYSQSAVALASNLLNIAAFAFATHAVVDATRLTAWVVLGALLVVLRIGLQKWFKSRYIDTNTPYLPESWENLFCIGIFFGGLHWGLAGVFLLDDTMVTQQIFLIFLLAGTTAGASVAYSVSLKAVLSFVAPALLPLAVKLALGGNATEYAMVATMALYFILLTNVLKRANAYVVSSIRLAFEKEDLNEQLKASQAEIVYSNKMAALGMMAGGIAHELNTPLAIINLSADELMVNSSKNKLEPEAIIESANDILTAVTRMDGILNSLRSFSKSKDDNAQHSVPIEKVISDALNMCRANFESRGMSVIYEGAPSKDSIFGRSSQISQALLNILTNSFEAVQSQPVRWVKVEVTSDEKLISISITDSGRGISPKIHDKVMQPFFTTKPFGQGSGLGLSTALGIIEEHGGDLTLDSKSDSTKFVIRLPKITAKLVLAS